MPSNISKDKRKEYKKRYMQSDKYKAEWQLVNCTCGSTVTQHHLSRHKLSNKHIKFETGERVNDKSSKEKKKKQNAYARAYNKMNADRIKAHRDEIMDCPCGSHVTRASYSKHKLTDKHEHYETFMFVRQL